MKTGRQMPLDFGRDTRIPSVFPIDVPIRFNFVQNTDVELLARLNGSGICKQRCVNQFASVLDLCNEDPGATNEVK